jgi:uncharacterized protein YbbC (DUF1343 family)
VTYDDLKSGVGDVSHPDRVYDRTMMRHLAVILLLFLLVACGRTIPDPPTAAAAAQVDPVRTGAQLLLEKDFAPLQGKRVGLVVNHTAMVDSVHLIDLVHQAQGVELVALFGPEHGLRGTADAGARISDGRDDQTGVPIYSLYGDVRQPTQAQLRDVDVLVFDIQDIGSRFYTYISTMGLSMQAAARAGVEFIVLDRPNPLGGEYVSGFVLEPEYESFVGQFPIPTVHGLTVGELALMIKSERMMSGLEDLELRVIKMEGWNRSALWPAVGADWLPPSPNIPDFETALIYAGTCLFEATSASEGRGTYEPFKLLGAPWADSEAIAEDLNARNLPGVRFLAEGFTPVGIEGMASSPKLKDRALGGIRIELTDAATFQALETGVHILHAFYRAAPDRNAFLSRPGWLDRLTGNDRTRRMLVAGRSPEEIISAWQSDVNAFREARQRYLLY